MSANDFNASITRIDSAKDLAQALCFAGEEFESGYRGQIAYIQAKRGASAVGGFFNPTAANVRTKFATVWAEENPGKPTAFPAPAGEDHQPSREETFANILKTVTN